MKHQPEKLIPTHGGYRHLKGFQLAELIFDVTVRFCDRYLDRKSRTRDQMVQAARSGKQNIGEGSIASGTSKKTELKLTNIARASLEELCLDYEDFLRGRGLEPWEPNHPALMRFKAKRPARLEEVRAWVRDERRRNTAAKPEHTDLHGRTRIVTDAELVANAALSLLNLCCHLLKRQIAAQERAFVEHGGFTERLYRIRSERRLRDLAH
jgi:four helix bundle suffix protein